MNIARVPGVRDQASSAAFWCVTALIEAAAAGLAVTLISVPMGYLIRGRIPDEKSNPLNRWLIALDQPLLKAVLRVPKLTLAVAAAVLAVSVW